MRRWLPAAGCLLFVSCSWFGLREPVPNPDPNHTHADFAVWLGGQKLDFSEAKYMSGSSDDPTSHPTEGPRKYLHLHDGNGHVIHRHKPGLTIGEFFASIGIDMQLQDDRLCINLEDVSVICSAGSMQWRIFVNGEEIEADPGYVFEDGDKILLTYDDGTETTAEHIRSVQLPGLTDDACLYSQTCPWRGKPPAENCISDPTVPCVAS